MKNQNKTQKAERLFEAFGNLDPDLLHASEAYHPAQGRRTPRVRRAVALVLAASLLLVLATFTAFAASPVLRGILNLSFLNENARKTQVPEGWIGIYTVEDLNAVREDLNGKYILMNDLTFTEADGSFTPIGNKETPFMGQFDGNGHVIRNMVIDVTQPAPPVIESLRAISEPIPFSYHDASKTCYVGLFGICGYSQLPTDAVKDRELYEFASPYLTDDQPYRGMVCNLGVENARISIGTASNVRVGVIAGQASYVVSCYVKNCTIDLEGYEAQADGTNFHLRMGGIAGNVQVLDSCYATDCSLTVRGADDLLSDDLRAVEQEPVPIPKATVFIGGLAGNAYTAVTSYAEGNEIRCDYAANRYREWWYEDHPAYTDALFGHVHLLPSVMNRAHFDELLQALYRKTHGLTDEDPLPETWNWLGSSGDYDDYLFRKFYTTFLIQPLNFLIKYFGLDPDQVNPSLLTGEHTWDLEMAIIDRFAPMDDLIRAENIATDYLGAEKLAEYVAAGNLKVGPHYCYHLSPYQEAYTESELDGFNFDTIWEMKDGRPILRIFQ